MRIQLWSYNYDPEPQGIAPLSATLARGLATRGHDVLVIAAHPHYPEPVWGRRLRPYRERRDGIPVLRVPLWPGRESGLARVRQELSFVGSLTAVAPLLPPTDAVIAVTPSFPALGCAAAFAQARRVPWVMWVQDIVTDGASTTGQLPNGPLLHAARRFERASYAAADKVVVISEAFRDNLLAKGVPSDRIERIPNPMTSSADKPNELVSGPPRILAMGNIGHTQGLDRIVVAFEGSEALAGLDARLVLAGGGVAADAARGAITTNRVLMRGVLYGDALAPELRAATLGLVSQRADITEFNLPSKLMNYMAHGIPVIASVSPTCETARIVRESGAGWVTDASQPAMFAETAARLLADQQALREAGRAGYAYAREHFSPDGVAARFEVVLEDVLPTHARNGSNPSPANRKSPWRHSPAAP
jgi:colanic acid biosynthesis glycosyl transferase WcaI